MSHWNRYVVWHLANSWLGCLFVASVALAAACQNSANNKLHFTTRQPVDGAQASNNDGASEAHVTRAIKNETASYGRILLIDVADSLLDVPEFLRIQAGECARLGQTCLLAATQPSCASCAALGYALAHNQWNRMLGSVRLIRLDVEEFESDITRLGLTSEELPSLALLDSEGKIAVQFDPQAWPSNNPDEFMPVVSDFITLRQHSVAPGAQSKSLGSWEL